MDETDATPMTDGDIAPPPAGTGFAPAAPLKDAGDVSFEPEGGGDTLPATAGARDQLRQGAQKLTSQAGDTARGFVDQGKDRATDALGQLAQILEEAAGQVDEKLGAQYGGYARQAAGNVQGFADQLRSRSAEDLLEDARTLVRKSPGAAIGIAAALGFAVARLASAGLDQREA